MKIHSMPNSGYVYKNIRQQEKGNIKKTGFSQTYESTKARQPSDLKKGDTEVGMSGALGEQQRVHKGQRSEGVEWQHFSQRFGPHHTEAVGRSKDFASAKTINRKQMKGFEQGS